MTSGVCKRRQYCWPHGIYHAHSCRLIEPYAPYDGRKAQKWRLNIEREKQTDTSAPLSILAMLISLALSPDCGCSATLAGQARASGVIPTSQNHNTRNAYTDVPIFLVQKNTKNITERHGFYFYPLYADTEPLINFCDHYPISQIAKLKTWPKFPAIWHTMQQTLL